MMFFAAEVYYAAKLLEMRQLKTPAYITVSGTANRLKENIQRVQANQAANEKARKEYEEYVARQKAEEEFWTRAAKK